MHSENFVQWLIEEKDMGMRSARDVLSRCGRVCRMLNITELDENSMLLLVECQKFKDCSMFIKSQLKRAVDLCLEFTNQVEKS